MKRKTIIIVGLTGILLTGTALTGIMATAYLSREKQISISEGISDGRQYIQAQPAPVLNQAPMPRSRADGEMKVKKDMRLATEAENYAPAKPAVGIVANDQIMHMPQPGTENEKYRDFEDNPVKQVSAEPVSTFSIDVDTAAYSVVRRYLRDGVLPPKDAVRTEELINYFNYDYALPDSKDRPFNADIAVYDTPWDEGTQIIRIGLQGYDIPAEDRPAANLVFLVDTSGSMNSPDKLPLLKKSLGMLVDQMDESDTIAIVAYAGSAGVVLEPTKGSEKRKIMAALESFRASGSTAGAEGIRQAYALAEANFNEEALNRVILATDGDFNVGHTENSTLEDYIARKRETGVYLSILGFGRGNYQDERMQVLAQAGNGNAAYIDNLMEARKVLVDEMGSTLFSIANDVKIQVEFNPAYVAEYRLIGYETRLLAREDFNNDKVDAGEVGSGHEVTALYEVTAPNSKSRLVDDLRYGKPEVTGGEENGEIALFRLRYKLPGEAKSTLHEQPIMADATVSFDKAPAEARFATAVAGFGQLLRGAVNVDAFSYDDVLTIAKAARGDDEFGYRSEFLQLVRLAKSAKTMEPLNN
ncbi:MAG: VWA domain-containing protein [Alphaproteobacteria bacterium]|nr:VWA domain-containing protein [Alphaproteobacteria bacterium]